MARGTNEGKPEDTSLEAHGTNNQYDPSRAHLLRNICIFRERMSLSLAVASLPKQNYAFTNFVYLNDTDFHTVRNASPLAAAEFDGEVKAYGVPVIVGTWIFSAR